MRGNSTVQFVTYQPLPLYDPSANALQRAIVEINLAFAMAAATFNILAKQFNLRKGLANNLLVSNTSLFVNPVTDALTPDANMAEELGFDDAYVTPSTIAGGTETFASNSVPDRSGSDEIMYVRLTGLTFVSHSAF